MLFRDHNTYSQEYGAQRAIYLLKYLVDPVQSFLVIVVKLTQFFHSTIRFDNIDLYSISLHQPHDKYLRLLMKPIEEMSYFEYTEDDAIISPREILPNSILIFDDDLCQTYSSTIKRLIRDNASHFNWGY